jgi:hypothetical protein
VYVVRPHHPLPIEKDDRREDAPDCKGEHQLVNAGKNEATDQLTDASGVLQLI